MTDPTLLVTALDALGKRIAEHGERIREHTAALERLAAQLPKPVPADDQADGLDFNAVERFVREDR